jgi:hypothetical protein
VEYNRVILGSKQCWVYTDLSVTAAPFDHIRVACVSNCLACSDVDVCSICEFGFYLEGSLCKGCNYSCRTCIGAGPYACLATRVHNLKEDLYELKQQGQEESPATSLCFVTHPSRHALDLMQLGHTHEGSQPQLKVHRVAYTTAVGVMYST